MISVKEHGHGHGHGHSHHHGDHDHKNKRMHVHEHHEIHHDRQKTLQEDSVPRTSPVHDSQDISDLHQDLSIADKDKKTKSIRFERRMSNDVAGLGSLTEVHILPAQTRADIISAANRQRTLSQKNDRAYSPVDTHIQIDTPDVESCLNSSPSASTPAHSLASPTAQPQQSKKLKKKTKKAKNMNMHGIFLHVLGDALGSVGVIISALIVEFCEGDWRFYVDPITSILITTIIVLSTIPLLKSACYILLQGVPRSIPIDIIKGDILALDGVLDIHEFHVWQLSDTKTVASIHILVGQASFEKYRHKSISSPDKTSASGPKLLARDYMEIAGDVKRLLHSYGIHSTTVQPEFSRRRVVSERVDVISRDGDEDDEETCLLQCVEESCVQDRCCAPISPRLALSDGAATGANAQE